MRGRFCRSLGDLPWGIASRVPSAEDRAVGWAEAMSRFTDTAGWPGPASWEMGQWPPGEDDHPVSGVSWGGAMGGILPAVEKRIRSVVLCVAGMHFQRTLPEVDQLNYITRVTQPTLMLNGELNFFFPAETSQRPMFELLGAPVESKKRLTYPRGHTVPKPKMIKESLAWLDHTLGPTA